MMLINKPNIEVMPAQGIYGAGIYELIFLSVLGIQNISNLVDARLRGHDVWGK